jgi:hypothetical protein
MANLQFTIDPRPPEPQARTRRISSCPWRRCGEIFNTPQKNEGPTRCGKPRRPFRRGRRKGNVGERELPVVCLEVAAAVGRLKPAAAEGTLKRMRRQTPLLSRRKIRRHERARLKLFTDSCLRFVSPETSTATSYRTRHSRLVTLATRFERTSQPAGTQARVPS